MDELLPYMTYGQTLRHADWCAVTHEMTVVNAPIDRRADPKIEPDAQADVAELMREIDSLTPGLDWDRSEADRLRRIARLLVRSRDMLESLATRNRALEGENTRLLSIASRAYEHRDAAQAANIKLSTEKAALEGAIEEHNKRCERECKNCVQFLTRKDRLCVTCPRRYRIEVPK